MTENRPNRIPWPPIIYLAAVVLGLALDRQWPLPWLESRLATVALILGVALGAGALLLDVIAFKVFRDHQTTILPHRGASRLITTGPFAWSRNPIYVGNTALVIAAGLVLGSLWFLLLAPVAALVTQKLAIEREEKHLAQMFDAEWEAYATRVRRWM
jgi:protein-S-isoprenylcysteine O-methyltransferase Ste14